MKKRIITVAFVATLAISSTAHASGSSGEVKPPQAAEKSFAMWIWSHIEEVFE